VNELPSVAKLAQRIDAVGDSSLERLDAAVRTAGELRDLEDRIVDRYVQAARVEGRSWAQIGDVLGVTRQAAQQRFVAPPAGAAAWPGMSEAAARVIGRAVEQAGAFRHRYLGTEHLLLALAGDDGLAGATLSELGVSPQNVTEQINGIIGPGQSSHAATLGVTPRTKRVLEAARKEARRVGHRCADTEHLLLAVSEHEGVADQILRALVGEPGAVRAQLAQLLEGEAPAMAAKIRTSPRRRLRRARG
jgi:hypothetical protein